MIKFHTIGQIEKEYHYENAVIDGDYFNGTFGDIVNGIFTPIVGGTKVIMQIEVGDDAGMPKYKIPSGTAVRVLDIVPFDGRKLEIYDYPLPEGVVEGDKLITDTDGSLIAFSGASAPYLEVTEIIGNHQGVVVNVVAE